MQYRKTMNGDQLSVLGFGCMRLPMSGGRIDEKKATAQVRYAIDNGVNYIDTAWPYHRGNSEPFLGRALQDGYRERIKLATKLPVWLCKNRADMDKLLNKQLEKLQTDHIDYYLIHSLTGTLWDQSTAMGVKEFIDDAKKSGKIINAGFSFHGSKTEFTSIVDDYPWDFCQIQYNILDENYQAGRSGLEYAAKKGLPVIVMEPLRGGALAGKLPKSVRTIYDEYDKERTNAQWAFKWLWNQPEVMVVLSGMNTIDQIDENIATAAQTQAGSLNQKELDIIDRVSNEYKKLQKVGCTGCEYCMPCPAGVDIPTVFHFYNAQYMLPNKLVNRGTYLGMLDARFGRKAAYASQCVSCNKCVEHCPQNIDIPSEMRQARRTLEGPGTGLLRFAARMLFSAPKVD